MEEIHMCDCCKDIWNRENLIKFDFTNNHKLFICPDCLSDMTNGDMIKAMFPTADIATNDKLGEAGTVFVHHKDNITIFHLDWWNEPYREEKE